MTSAERNRKNAIKSTGPRTAAGKAVVSLNATRHGLLGRDLLLASEHPESFEELSVRLTSDLQPKGALEELLCEKLIWAAWRMKRLFLMEKSVFKSVSSVKGPADNTIHFVIGSPKDKPEPECITFVGSEDLVKEDEPETAFQTIMKTMRKDSPQYDSNGPSLVDLVRIEQAAEEAGVDVELIYQKYLAEKARGCGPEAGTQGKEPLQLLARYEANLERTFYKALHELQRTQALRSGQSVSLPATVDISLNSNCD